MESSSKAPVPMATLKRAADHLDGPSEAGPSKQQKLFPLFAGTTDKAKETTQTFRWIEPALGPSRSCLHGVNLAPIASCKVAAFDLDGCLIQPSIGKKKDKGVEPSFQWWRPVVPRKLKEVHDSGYAIIIITNQGLRSKDAITKWKNKPPLIGAALSDVPFRLLAATAKDGYRKPMPGMWYELEHIFAEENVTIDKGASFFIGDAAGRKGDFAGTDRKWALNVGIPFFTPEEYFLKLNPAPYTLQGFHPSSLPTDLPRITPTSTPLLPSPQHQELVLFVGPPALGKTTFFRTHFAPAGYTHVNQDTLKTRDKCIKTVQENLAAGASCVVDNTNRDKATRQHYVALARKHKVPIRCFHFTGSSELAWHNNLYRAFNLPPSVALNAPKRELLPYTAFTSYKAAFEAPSMEEGFKEIKQVNWVFEGSEEDKRRWGMWLQIDGK